MTTVDYMVYWRQLSSQDWKGVRHVLLLSSSSGALVLVGWLAKKNFSISKLQSNILTLTDWPPFVNAAAAAAAILPKGMREAIRPGPGCAGVCVPLPSAAPAPAVEQTLGLYKSNSTIYLLWICIIERHASPRYGMG